MDAVLTKPVDAEQLLLALDETVGRLSAPPSAASLLTAPAAGPPAAAPVLIRTDAPSTVTPITVHPRFPTDPSGIVDEAAIDALRALGGGSDFFRDVIETFRSDARQILEEIARSVAEGDIRAFREHAHSLRSSAANVGGARLCNALLSLRDVTARELRSDGRDVIERLEAELARLDTALEQKLREAKRG
jgi:two-component system sensor histidine kinase RpfC